MFLKCPKCSFVRPPGDTRSKEACPACGLIFAKFVAAQSGAPVRARGAGDLDDEAGDRDPDMPAVPAWLAPFFFVPEKVESWRCWTGAALYALSLYFGWRYYFMDIPSWEMSATFMHAAILPFHEFGHILFSPFGEWLHNAGGSLAQVLMPLAFLGLFTFKNRDNFTAALMLWWSGTQWLDCAPYAWDAKAPVHVLLSGRTGDTGGHDYIDMLGIMGLLDRAHQVAWVMHKTGLLLMLAAWAWGGYILYRQFQRKSEFADH